MGTDDNDRLEESGPKMIADTKLLFRNAEDGEVGYTHLILVIKQGRISNAALRALSIVKNVLPEEAWGNVMLYNSYAEDDTEVDEWFEESRQLANDGDANAKKLMEVKALLDAHGCPQLAGSLKYHRKSKERDEVMYQALREGALAGLLEFVHTQKTPIPEMKMTWNEFWASGGGERIWASFTSTFTAKARKRYNNASEFLQQALGLYSMTVTCSACSVQS
jgi:hypothetical protein